MRSTKKLYLIFISLFYLTSCISVSSDKPNLMPYETSSTLSERLENALPSVSQEKSPLSNGNKSSNSLNLPGEKHKTTTSIEHEITTTSSVKNLLISALNSFKQLNYSQAELQAKQIYEKLKAQRSKDWNSELKNSPLRETALLLGTIELHTPQVKDGIEILSKLVQVNPTWSLPYYILGEHYFTMGAYSLARFTANKGLDRSNFTSPELYVIFARSELALNNGENAYKIMLRAAKRFPNSFEVQYWLGVANMKLGKTQAACENFAKVYAQDVLKAEASYNYGICLLKQGKWVEAEKQVAQTLFNYPQDADLHYLLGIIYHHIGNFPSAHKEWTSFLALSSLQDFRHRDIEILLEMSTMTKGTSQNKNFQ